MEAAALALSGGNTELRAEESAAKDRAEMAEDALAGMKNSREKPKFPGEDLEKIPGFEEGVLVNAGPEADMKAVITGEPDEAADAEKPGPRPARFEKSEKTEKSERTEKTGKSGETGLIETFQTASPEQTEGLPADETGAALAAAETAESAAERAFPGRNPDRLAAKTEGAAETGLNPAAAEVAVLPRQQKSLTPERPEKNSREEPGEAKKGDRRRERLNLELRDFHTTPKTDGTAGPERTGGEAKNGDHAPNHGQEAEITVELKSQAHSQAEVSFNRENRPQLSFREMLARELHENLNGDIVRHASVILKNGGEGLIRLSLKPEHLGNVKIRLEMTENKIVGRITVESNEALRAFEQEIRSLEQAFRDSGFEGASLEMAVSSGSGQDGTGRQWEGGEASRWPGPFFSERAVHSYDAAGDTDGMRWFNGGVLQQVNVLA
jgi:flagellar hook-length control protein FliK